MRRRDNRETYYKVALILGIISMVFWGMLILPLLWQIPMLINIKKRYNFVKENPFQEEEYSSLTLGILSLIFLNVISGIFIILADMLFEPKSNSNKQDNKIEKE